MMRAALARAWRWLRAVDVEDTLEDVDLFDEAQPFDPFAEIDDEALVEDDSEPGVDDEAAFAEEDELTIARYFDIVKAARAGSPDEEFTAFAEAIRGYAEMAHRRANYLAAEEGARNKAAVLAVLGKPKPNERLHNELLRRFAPTTWH